MKKYYTFACGLLLWALLACSSTPSQMAEKMPENIAVSISETIKETLPDSSIYDSIEVWRDSVWLDIEKQWTEQAFNPCLKKNKIKISCGSCTGVYMELNFYINAQGKLDKYEVLRSRFCEKEGMESCMMDFFQKMTFPEKYYNTIFKTRLGRYLKC